MLCVWERESLYLRLIVASHPFIPPKLSPCFKGEREREIWNRNWRKWFGRRGGYKEAKRVERQCKKTKPTVPTSWISRNNYHHPMHSLSLSSFSLTLICVPMYVCIYVCTYVERTVYLLEFPNILKSFVIYLLDIYIYIYCYQMHPFSNNNNK